MEAGMVEQLPSIILSNRCHLKRGDLRVCTKKTKLSSGEGIRCNMTS